MFNIYPDPLKFVLRAIEVLDALDQATEEGAEGTPYLKSPIRLTDQYGTDYGELRDEIGGSWSWFPPETADTEALLNVLAQVDDESVRDPTPHSSAWLITASAMENVRRALGRSDDR